LKQGDDFDNLKKTTVIFINLNNQGSNRLLDEVELRYGPGFTQTYSDKFKIIEINLNNIMKDKDSITNPNLLLYIIFCIIGDRENGFRSICEKFGLNSAEIQQVANELSNRLKAIKGEIPPEVINDKNLRTDDPIIIEEMEVYEMFAGEVYLERGRKEGREQGIQEGEKRAKTTITKINKLYVKEKKSIDEIAKELKLTSEEVRTSLIELGYDLENETDTDTTDAV
jgi:hypothetical protein